MGNTVFTSWALWQKLTFGLGCAMVVVILIGCVKLCYTRWRLRKYSALAEQEKREQALARQMSQRRRGPDVEGKEEVLFGIRALESGVAVDGVWVSRPNTPDGSSRHSSTGSLALQNCQRAGTDVDIEKQVLPGHGRASSNSTATSARRASSAFDSAASPQRLPSNHVSRDSSPERSVTRPPKSRHPPCSYSKYSAVPYTYRQSNTMSTLEGLEAIHRASTSIRGDGGSGSSDSSSGNEDSGSIYAAAPRLLTGQTSEARPPRRPSVDIEMLNNHRISQAAETGQLTPRTRKTGDWSGASAPASAVSLSDQIGYFTSRQRTPMQTAAEDSPVLPSSPKVDALPAAVRRSSMPEGVTPFSKFCQTAPPTPVNARASSQERSPQRLRNQSSSINTSLTPSPVPAAPKLPEPVMLQSSPGPDSHSPPRPATRPSFEKRHSQVLRGHGSGFEILKPGSLNPPPPSNHPMQRQRAAPPVSLQNSTRSRSRSSSFDSRRKLQKKRRPSLDSQTSSETGKSSKSNQSRYSVL